VILVNHWELQTDFPRAGSIILSSVVEAREALQLSAGAWVGVVGQERGY
jgi:hypothetical protein